MGVLASLTGRSGQIPSFLWALAFLLLSGVAGWKGTSGVLKSAGSVYGWTHSHPGQILRTPFFSKQGVSKEGISTNGSF